MKTENQKGFSSGFPLSWAVTLSSLSWRFEVQMGGGCRMWENMAVPRGQENLDRTWQTSSRMRSVRQEAPPPPSPPGWHSSLVKHRHKSQLPPRSTLGPPSPTTRGPRQQHPPTGSGGPAPAEWWDFFPGTYPQCSGFLRSSPSSSARKPLCYYFLRDSSWVPSPTLAGEEVGVLLRGACPHPLASASLPTYPLPPQSCSERAR